MTKSNVTLKDIAKAMGVTTTTVHRALQGKEGVSEATRREVQRVAAEMGYRSNYMAAALKRKQLRIAIALPEPTYDNKYYYGNIWLGARRFLSEVAEFNITPLEYTYPLTHGANGAVLKEIYETHGDSLDGVLTMAVDNGQSSYFIEKLAQKNIPVVFVGSDMYPDQRFCCVKTYDEMAGGLAAELLCAFNSDTTPKKVVLTGHFGHLGMKDQHYNAGGFESYLKEHAPQVQVLPIHGEDTDLVTKQVGQALEFQDIYAIYSASARYTVHMAKVVQKLGMAGKVKIIGNDSFEESLQLLADGVISAIIDKKIARQSYLATKALFDYLVKSEYPPSSVMYVRPEVVLRSNVNRSLMSAGFYHPGDMLD